MGTGGNNVPILPVAIKDTRSVNKKQNGCGYNEEGVAYTLDALATQGVAAPTYWDGGQRADTLDASISAHYRTMPDKRRFNGVLIPQAVVTAYDPKDLGRRSAEFIDQSPTLKQRAGTGGNNVPIVGGYKVRRLTPTECERLQGFPDGWTEGQSDTVRYKALGNSVAIPCVEFVIGSIVRFVETEVTQCDTQKNGG